MTTMVIIISPPGDHAGAAGQGGFGARERVRVPG
jgi:hypothetical protein